MKTRARRSVVVGVEQVEGRCLLSAVPQYTVKDLGVVDWINSINNLGQVAGTLPQPGLDPFLTAPNGNSLQDLGPAVGRVPFPGKCINDSGQIVTTTGTFSVANGSTTLISDESGTAINNIGQIAGETSGGSAYVSDPNGTRGFVNRFCDLG
jgi:hypothetical protein